MPTDLLVELKQVCSDLALKHLEYAHVVGLETERRAEAYHLSQEKSHAARASESEYSIKDFAVQRIDIRGEIDALRETQTYLLAALQYTAPEAVEYAGTT